MKEVINKKTGVIKQMKTEEEVAMYLSTNEWEIYVEKTPIEKQIITKKEKK